MASQLDLFSQAVSRGECLGIAGLIYVPGILCAKDQREVLAAIDDRPWLSDLKRRVQHYGYKYDYKTRSINQSMYVGPLPMLGVRVAQLLVDKKLMPTMPDQLIVNEYLPGQGITAHVDCEPCFADTIATVSLGSAYEMEFVSVASGEARVMVLEVGSGLVLSGEARYQWMHRIRARRSDHGVPRGRRVSLTFRSVIISEEPRSACQSAEMSSPRQR